MGVEAFLAHHHAGDVGPPPAWGGIADDGPDAVSFSVLFDEKPVSRKAWCMCMFCARGECDMCCSVPDEWFLSSFSVLGVVNSLAYDDVRHPSCMPSCNSHTHTHSLSLCSAPTP
jgi:hypothetical protein